MMRHQQVAQFGQLGHRPFHQRRKLNFALSPSFRLRKAQFSGIDSKNQMLEEIRMFETRTVDSMVAEKAMAVSYPNKFPRVVI